jgi:site-specific DNA-methyltransferase (adenine-specific)
MYEVHGIPTDMGGAMALFNENPFDFERWAVSEVQGEPNEKQVGDKGIDGRIRFYWDRDKLGTVIVSVKGGQQLNPAMVQQLLGAVTDHKAIGGLLITLGTPTKGMVEIANHSGTFDVPLTGNKYPRLQIVTIAQLLAHYRPNLPTAILPYIPAAPKPGSVPVSLFTEP